MADSDYWLPNFQSMQAVPSDGHIFTCQSWRHLVLKPIAYASGSIHFPWGYDPGNISSSSYPHIIIMILSFDDHHIIMQHKIPNICFCFCYLRTLSQFLAPLAVLYPPLVTQWLTHWLTATLEFRNKERLLRIVTLQIFDQSDNQTERRKDKTAKNEKRQKYQKTKKRF